MVKNSSFLGLCIFFFSCFSTKNLVSSESEQFISANRLHKNKSIVYSSVIDSIESIESIKLYEILCNDKFCMSNYSNEIFLVSNYSLCFENTGLIVIADGKYSLITYPMSYIDYKTIDHFLDSICDKNGILEYILNEEVKVKKRCINNEEQSKW